jgi:hypothetical protein
VILGPSASLWTVAEWLSALPLTMNAMVTVKPDFVGSSYAVLEADPIVVLLCQPTCA